MSQRDLSSNVNPASAQNRVNDSELKPQRSTKWLEKLAETISRTVRPVPSLSTAPKRRSRKSHSTTTPVLASQGLEGLESRMLLTITVNQLTIENGQSVVLSTTNIDSTDPQELYHVQAVVYGHFEKGSAPGTSITSFSQADITGGKIKFVHDNSGNAPDYELYWFDGVMFAGPNKPQITFGTPPAAPEITSNGGGATASISIAENQSTAATVTATDANTSDTLTYSISGGDDAAKFSIDGTTGVLSFVATPNFEAPDDTGANHVYNVNVKVTDSTDRTDEQSLEITITDANESVTATSSPTSMYVLDKQDTTDGVVIGTLTFGDPDDADSDATLTGSDAHVYTLSGADKNYFSIDRDSILLYADVVDASAKSSYSATLTITDGPNTKEIPLNVTVRTLQQQIDAAEDGDTLTLIPGRYSGLTVKEKNMNIIANGVTIQGGFSALVVDTANVTITGATFIDGTGDPEVEQPVIGVVKDSTLTLVACTVISESMYTLSLIGVDGTSTLDLSSGDNSLDSTTTTNAFTLLLEGAEIVWDAGNTLRAETYEDQSVNVDARIDGSDVVNLFTTPETKGYVIVNDDGTLTYTPDENFSGTATFDFELASGAPGRIVIGIQSVNDQPAFVVGSNVSVDADAEGVQTVEGQIDLSLVNFGPGDENSTQSGTFTTTATNLDLFLTAPSIESDGNLTFELDTEALLSLAQGETVTSEVSVTLQDDGGTDDGGIDTSDTLTFTITVVGQNDAPTTGDATNSGDEDATITGTLTAKDVDPDAFVTFSQVGTVAGLTINSDGTYSFDASDDAYQSLKQGETLEVVAQYQATDEFGALSTSSLRITLTGTNDAPVAADELNTGVEGDLITGNIAQQDIDHDAVLSFRLVDDVPGLIINDNGSYSFDASKSAYASLKQGETRDFTAEYSVTDEYESSSSGSLTIRLTGTNNAPEVQIAELPAFSVSEDPGGPLFLRGIQVLDVDAYDAAVTVTLSVRNGTLSVDPDAAAAGHLTYSGSGTRSLSLSGTLSDLNRFMGQIRRRSVTSVGVQYLPDGNYNTIDGAANTQGAECITVSATDDNNAVSDEVTKAITVTEVNDAPAAIATTKIVNEDGSVTFNISSVAAPGPALESWNQSLSLIGGGKIVAAHGFVTMNLAAGTVTYRPTANYYGLDMFSFQVRDNGTTNGVLDRKTSEITITMTIRPVNDAPTFTIPASAPSVNDTSGAQSLAFVLASSVGPSNERDNAAHGPFTAPHNNQQTTRSYVVTNNNAALFSVQPAVDAAGNLTYQPTPGATGVATVSVTLNDGGGTENGGVPLSTTKSFTITVTGVNDPPVASNGTFTATEDTVLNGDLYSLVSDPETADTLLTYTQVGGPLAGLTLNANGTFSYLNPTANFYGTVSFQYKVSDGTLESETRTVTISVNSVNDAPELASNGGGATASISVPENSTAVTTVAGSDADVPAQTLSYSISGGADAGEFAINSTTGVLTFLSGRDFENPNDADRNGVYEVEVQVTDGLLTDTQRMSITVTDLHEPPTILGPATNTTEMRPTLSWTSVATAASYEITVTELLTGSPGSKLVVVNNGSGNTTLENYRVSGTSYTLPSDLGIGRFNYWVRAVDRNGVTSEWSSGYAFNVTTAVIINPLSNIRQLVPRPAITWQPLPGAVTYDIWVDDRTTLPAKTQVVRTEVSETSWTHTSDLSIGRYRIWVRGIDEKGIARSWSAYSDFVVAPAPAVNPIVSTFDRTPTFSWTSVAGALNYEIVVKSGIDGTDVFRQTVVGTSATPSSDLGVGSYNWQVRAIGTGGYSSNFTANSTIFVGGRPTANPVVVNAGIPTFSWLGVQGSATYEIRVDRIDSPETNVVNAANLTGTSVTHSSSLRSGTYRFWVRAISTSPPETSLWSIPVDFTIAEMPTPGDENALNTSSLIALLPLMERPEPTGGRKESTRSPEISVNVAVPQAQFANTDVDTVAFNCEKSIDVFAINHHATTTSHNVEMELIDEVLRVLGEAGLPA